MTETTRVYVTEEPPAKVTVLNDGVTKVTVTEEQANIVRLAVAGIQGPPGTQIIDGAGPPSPSVGRLGDFFIDRDDALLWGPKNALGWGDPVSFGVSELSELTDVQVSSTADMDVLMWDDTDGKWKNRRIRHRHTQATPSDYWEINHGLGAKPAGVSVFDTSGTQSFGEVDHVDDNNLTITFSAPFAGVAYLG